MGFIFGIFSFNGTKHLQQSIMQLSQGVKWDGFQEEVVFHDTYALGYCWNSSRTPNVDIFNNEELSIICDARIYNTDTLKSSFQFSTNAEALAQAYKRWGENFAAYIAGDFAAVIFDKKKEEVILTRDHIGARPLCYYFKNNALIFASHEFGIAKSGLIPVTISEKAAIHTFFRLSKKQRYDLTSFENVYKIKPGYSVVFNKSKQKSIKYWNPEKIKKQANTSIEEVKSQLKDLLHKSVSQRIGDGIIGCHISGGLDSSAISSIIADIIDQKERVIGYSWSPQNPDLSLDTLPENGINEKILVDEFSNAKGIKVKYLASNSEPILENYMMPELEYLPLEIEIMKQAERDGTAVIFSGWGGDEFVSISLRGIASHLLFSGNIRALLKWIRHFGTKETISRILGEIRPIILPKLLRNRSDLIKSFSYFTLSFIVKNWSTFMLHWQPCIYGGKSRRKVMLQLLYNYHLPQRMDTWALMGEKYGVEYKFPLLDRELIEYWFTVPSEYTYTDFTPRILFREALKEVLPESIRVRKGKQESLLQHSIFVDKQAILGKLASSPELFNKKTNVTFFKSQKFYKNLKKVGKSDKKAKQLFNDLRIYFRYIKISDTYCNNMAVSQHRSPFTSNNSFTSIKFIKK